MAVYFNDTKVSTIYRGSTRLTRLLYQGVIVFSEEAIVRLTVSAKKRKYKDGTAPYIAYGWTIDYIYHLYLVNEIAGTENVTYKISTSSGYLNNVKRAENPYLTGVPLSTDSTYSVPEDRQLNTGYPKQLTITYAGKQRVIDLPAIRFDQIVEADVSYADVYAETYSTVN